jgi:hypothetical protein
VFSKLLPMKDLDCTVVGDGLLPAMPRDHLRYVVTVKMAYAVALALLES